MELFCGKERVGVVLAKGECAYVRRAAEDLCLDISRVSLGAEGVLSGDGKIFIGTKGNDGVLSLPMATELLDGLTQREEYRICVDGDRVVILGRDYFGTMWGIYTFSKEFLGVEPTYLFSDAKPKRQKRLTIPEGVTGDHPHTYRFRGWFINDEDLLTSWDRSAGHRPYFKINHYHIASPKVMEMVAETALRLRMNLLIPASHVDITKENEAALVKTVTDRGLFVSQHHVEPLGVIGYYFQDYWKERGRELEVSFGKYKEEYVEVWRHYVSKWSAYPNVVWQLGLRGFGDRPIWHEDPSIPNTSEAHGKVIGDAIALQHSIIREITGEDTPLCTATLWMEGAQLYTDGSLTLPKGTGVVFADVALTQMMGEDFHTVPRREEGAYGIYYHVQLSQVRNHLTEGTEPEKMLYNYRQAVDKGDTYYSVLNVSNLREFVYSASLNAAITWNIDEVTVADFTRSFCERVYGDGEIASLYREYYECFYEQGDAQAKAVDAGLFYHHEYGETPFMLMPAFDYNVRDVGLQAIKEMTGDRFWVPVKPLDMAKTEGLLREARKRFGRLYRKVLRKAETLPPAARAAYDTHLLMHTEFLYYEHLWAENLLLALGAEGKERTRLVARALKEGRKMWDVALKRCTAGRWKHWYRGSRVEGLQRIDVCDMLAKTESALARLSDAAKKR
ncbi:MAG: glycosyl hydrolase 115 family protein [Clostridia bacterium]|nr:glycosyl hydrolase 115 family protein [Clostridia bacterium]